MGKHEIHGYVHMFYGSDYDSEIFTYTNDYPGTYRPYYGYVWVDEHGTMHPDR